MTTGRHEHTWPPATGEPQPVWRTPADGPQKISAHDASLLMFGWHDEHVRDQDCCDGTSQWHMCTDFVAARIRGMHRTMFVVPMSYDPTVTVYQRYAVVTLNDDAQPDLREGFDGYHAALLFAASICASEMARETGR